ncbi:MAG TPA: hypothetical protein VFQ53_32240 [Kofleriaceae bacterium]|nr:hypothetical protein [Kofleriaceae bacterium]
MAVAVLLISSAASAVNPRTTRQRVAADTLTAMPAAGLAKPLRSYRDVRFEDQGNAAWLHFTATARGSWRIAWDRATGVPNRIWGSGISVPGANASAVIAASAARTLLADHLALLAPGASPSDFELVSNTTDGDQRSVGFVQKAGGLRVVGGQISFRFKRDRLFVIASEALPNVRIDGVTARMKPAALVAKATDNLRAELLLPNAPVTSKGDEVVLPLVADDTVMGYRVARPLQIDGGADGRYLAYVDPATGAVLAVHQQNTYAQGTLLYRSVDRYPARPRVDRPAPRAHVVVGGAPQTTTSDGVVTWSPDVPQTVSTAVVGDLVTIVNKASDGVLATNDLSLPPAGSTVWDLTANPEQDAQLTTYIAVNTVKDFVRAKLDPVLPHLDEPMTANVNIAQNCNAFFDGEAINFFHASQMCQNTGLLEDVVFHEFGHNLHAFEIIDGVGSFEGAMSEGAADFLAAIMTNDSGMGRGFFYTDEPLRELDPPDTENRWPEDIGEIHKTGIIYGGALWDLRKALIAQLGVAQGTNIVNKIYIGTLRRSTSIPSSLIEALATDDDDGDLSNGTPHECLIRAAYGRHGLRTATGTVLAPGVLSKPTASTVVRVDVSGLSERCTGDEIDTAVLSWKPSFTPTPEPGEIGMTKSVGNQFYATMPLAENGLLYYTVKVNFKDGSVLTLADNLADPFYSVYTGDTIPLYCTNFENTSPWEEGWTTGTADGSPTPWVWGPAMTGNATDPPVAFSGGNLLQMNPGGDYAPKAYSFVKLPPIDVGQWSDVRLQYRRWLAVEDSEYDKARVTVNGRQAWINFTANIGSSSSTHHIDREWRFHDVGVTGYAFGHVLDIGWDLTSDEGLHLGGWALDDVCVVANIHSVCGDGVKTPTEQCDNGADNADAPNHCRTYCRAPTCGDSIVDEGEDCDDGPSGSTTCTPMCLPADDGGGCCSTGSDPRGALALCGVVGLMLVRRRRQ